MEPADHEQVMNDDDFLSLWVGRVARTHALLEYNVDNVHRFLARRVGDVPGSKSVKGFDQLVSDCRKLLQRSDVGREIAMAGDTALLAAREATIFRNRVVHDMWLLDPHPEDGKPPRWNTFHRLGDVLESYNSSNPQDLKMIVDAHTLLTRTRMRVSGLFMALHATWSGDCVRGQGSSDGDTMARYVALMADRFILHTNGDFDVT
jgi:hypothetical protein